jgi:hypothetical protein
LLKGDRSLILYNHRYQAQYLGVAVQGNKAWKPFVGHIQETADMSWMSRSQSRQSIVLQVEEIRFDR